MSELTDDEHTLMVMCCVNGYSFEEFMQMIGRRKEEWVLGPFGQAVRVR